MLNSQSPEGSGDEMAKALVIPFQQTREEQEQHRVACPYGQLPNLNNKGTRQTKIRSQTDQVLPSLKVTRI